MAENTSEKHDKSNKNKTIYIVIGILAAVLVVAGYFIYNLNQDKKFISAELESTSTELETMRTELDEKIIQLERLGENVDSLRAVRANMETEIGELKKNNQMAWSSYKKIKDKVEGYAQLLKMKDEEIAHLKAVNDELFSENTELKTEKNQLNDSISGLALSQQQLTKKVEMASRLKAENIKIYAVNDRGKEREGEFRSRYADKLKIEFNIGENEVAPVEGKDILIRILEPEGNVLFDVARGSGSFMYNGKEEFYTAQQQILFDNSGQQLTFLYEKGSEFGPGKHKVEIYTDGYIMGAEDFFVK
ncbi:MAG: chromosome segregation protein SMC [Cyclobacteriaceae bacterium]